MVLRALIRPNITHNYPTKLYEVLINSNIKWTLSVLLGVVMRSAEDSMWEGLGIIKRLLSSPGYIIEERKWKLRRCLGVAICDVINVQFTHKQSREQRAVLVSGIASLLALM